MIEKKHKRSLNISFDFDFQVSKNSITFINHISYRNKFKFFKFFFFFSFYKLRQIQTFSLFHAYYIFKHFLKKVSSSIQKSSINKTHF